MAAVLIGVKLAQGNRGRAFDRVIEFESTRCFPQNAYYHKFALYNTGLRLLVSKWAMDDHFHY